MPATDKGKPIDKYEWLYLQISEIAMNAMYIASVNTDAEYAIKSLEHKARAVVDRLKEINGDQ